MKQRWRSQVCVALAFVFITITRHVLDHLVGLVVKASASRAGDPGFKSHLRRDFFRGRVTPVTEQLALQWLSCQAPGVIGSVLGLVGPVSVYCDWVRWIVGSAASISVWQDVKLSERIRPWDKFACCWDVKQPTNIQTMCPIPHHTTPHHTTPHHTTPHHTTPHHTGFVGLRW